MSAIIVSGNLVSPSRSIAVAGIQYHTYITDDHRNITSDHQIPTVFLAEYPRHSEHRNITDNARNITDNHNYYSSML